MAIIRNTPLLVVTGSAWVTSKVTNALSEFGLSTVEPYFEGIALLFTAIGLVIKGFDVFLKWQAQRKRR